MPRAAKIPLLRWPSTGILVTAVMGLIAGLDLMSMHAGFWLRDPGGATLNEKALARGVPPGIAFNAGLFLTNVSLFHTFGALYMRRGVRYRLAMASAITSCIPLLSPMVYFGIPFGIWALVVLRRKDVRAAFEANVKA
jgi:hypothetical protein